MGAFCIHGAYLLKHLPLTVVEFKDKIMKQAAKTRK